MASITCAATHRFDHVELGSFAGGHTAALAINHAGLAVGNSGDIAIQNRHAFVAGADGAPLSINTLGLHSSAARAINNAGQIAGTGCFARDESCMPVAFRYSSAGGMQNLGMLPGGTSVTVQGINAHGDVIGDWFAGNRSVSHAFVFSDGGGLVDLGHLGGGTSQVSAVNDLQVVVGDSRVGPLPSHVHAFRWHNGVMTDLGTLGGVASSATDINNAGTIVGWALDANWAGHAFVYTNDRGMQPLPFTNGAISSAALAINEAGMILTTFQTPDFASGSMLFMPDGTSVEIPLLDGFPTGSPIAMNNLGHVVGANVLVIGSEEIVSAFYWSPQTGTIQLDDAIISELPWTIFDPVAINDNDQIIVHAIAGSTERSALLRPALDGDVNGDRTVNIDDLLGVINQWGPCPPAGGCHADFDHSDAVDIDDLLEVITHWK